MDASAEFNVIIVGGSIAGLTLAHCLHRAGIDHIVLEKRPEIAPEEGASIGLWPTGGQILHQLGLWEDVARGTEPLLRHNVRFPDGSGYSHRVLGTIYERFGYGLTFVERQKLLQVLYDAYPKKEKILLNRGVVEVREIKDGVLVVTEDGSIYKGSLVVGADGVHSRVRTEMWHLAASLDPRMITDVEKKAMTAEYYCVFGMSSPIAGLRSGEHGNVYGDGLTVLTFHGKERVYWFVVSKMDRKYTYPDISRFKQEDAENLCRWFSHISLADGVTVQDLWESREVASMTAMEEGLFETWSVNRMVLLGDAVRKMTVNMGQGANCAIEDAAALATLLDRLVKSETTKSTPNGDEINSVLDAFRRQRYARSKAIFGQTMFGVRLYTRDSLMKRIMGRYVMPRKLEHMADATSTLMADGPVIGFLPPPPRTTPGWKDYSSEIKHKQQEGWTSNPNLLVISGVAALSILAYSRFVLSRP
ncbi:FAD-dependent oxidoreductase [Aspergillus stella-maris]|uniref:FAD-dependent oxidoreductase n=1 Tax=Aspergillus stella-maris TaxID=1810926 RepID=UPI003CCD8A86